MSTIEIDRRFASGIVEQLVRSGLATPTSRVLVIGCEHIELVIALAHRGFTEVTCQATACGPSTGEPPADLVIIPKVRSNSDVITVLSQAKRWGPKTVFVFGAARSAFPTMRQALKRQLVRAEFLFSEEETRRGLRLLCARKVPPLQAQAA